MAYDQIFKKLQHSQGVRKMITNESNFITENFSETHDSI